MTTTMEPTVKRHPIRGALWGLLFGIGLATTLIGFAVVAAGTLTPWVVVLACIALGALWGAFAPARSPKDASTGASAPPPAPAASTTDPSTDPPGDELMI